MSSESLAEVELAEQETLNVKKCSLCHSRLPKLPIQEKEFHFCCPGCRIVYFLLEARNQLEGFKENPVFIEALNSGLIANPHLLEEIQRQKDDLLEGEKVKIYLEIADMWCPSCAEIIQLVLLREKGIINCVVDYSTDLASVEFLPRYLSKEKIIAIIKEFGYLPQTFEVGEQVKSRSNLNLRFIVALFCSLNVMMFAYPLYATYFNYDGESYGGLFAWLSFFTSLPVLTYSAWPIWRRFAASAKAGFLGTEMLVAVGVFAAFCLSLYELLQGGTHVYFDSMTVIILFMLLGKIIETKAKFSAKESLLRLCKSVPKKGRKRFSNGILTFIPAKEILKEDILEVYTGEKIPVDGLVIEGEGSCNEAVMTGEAIPMRKVLGSSVLAGSILIQGRIAIQVTTTIEETALQKIIQIVEKDLGYKSSYVRAADSIVQWFTPFVIAIATCALLFAWFLDPSGTDGAKNGWIRAVAVLLISCPCAIGIAAPLVESQVLHALASMGAIVRNRGCLPLIGKETLFVFDKTGTVTEGKFSILAGVETLTIQEREILATLAAHSMHPISIAIAKFLYNEQKVPFETIHEYPGKGMEGIFNGMTYLLGSENFLRENEIVNIPFSQSSGEEPISYVYFAHKKICLTQLVLGDTVRAEIGDLIKKLNPAKKVLLSGDGEAVVSSIARKCGFDASYFSCSPLEKREFLRRRKLEGEIICMIGDGINDAPALAYADIGIAVSSASDMSLHVSDLLLRTQDLGVILKVRTLVKRGNQIIKQNLFWAFFYNIIGIFLAAFGILTPVFAAFAMSASSVTVMLNAKRVGNRDEEGTSLILNE